MSDNLEENLLSAEQPAKQPQQSAQNNSSEKSHSTTPAEEFIKKISGKKTFENIDEFSRGLGAAVVYIDHRSGGNYFEGNADIDGDVIGRNQKSPKSSSVKEVVGQVLSTDIDKITTVYLPTHSYTQIESVLKDKHVLILCGESHLGKRTTAIHLLLSLLKVEEVFEINPTVKVEEISSFKGDTSQAYLIDTLEPESAGKLNNYLLNILSQKLGQLDSYLVITIDSRVRIFQENCSEYILKWNDLPPNDILLQKHLAWYLKTSELLDSSQNIIEAESVRDVLSNKLLPGDVDRLAELLAKVVREELSLEEALAGFNILADQKVKSWFEDHQKMSQRIFMITLAVLSGSSYQGVVDASKRLLSIIKPSPEKEELSELEQFFSTTRSQRLKECLAHLVQGYENANFGQHPVELVDLDNSAFQPAILAYVWHELDHLRDPLLIWLYELGSHDNFEVQIRAAAAVGELSKYGFKHILNQILQPWANCQNQNLQRLAALALSIPVFESELAPQVLGLLHSWSTLENNLNLRWTATAAYGGYVGLRFPDAAIRDLFTIAKSGDEQLFPVVIESVANLFESGKLVPELYFTVLNALREWTEQKNKKTINELGLLIFWMLIYQSKNSSNSNNNDWHTVLWLVNEDQVYEDLVICLLQRALNLKLTSKIMLEEIHNWLKQVDYDRRLYRVIGRIIYTLVDRGTKFERERMFTYLERWASLGQSNAASEILSLIKKHLSI